jgi:hypothetical protein
MVLGLQIAFVVAVAALTWFGWPYLHVVDFVGRVRAAGTSPAATTLHAVDLPPQAPAHTAVRSVLQVRDYSPGRQRARRALAQLSNLTMELVEPPHGSETLDADRDRGDADADRQRTTEAAAEPAAAA